MGGDGQITMKNRVGSENTKREEGKKMGQRLVVAKKQRASQFSLSSPSGPIVWFGNTCMRTASVPSARHLPTRLVLAVLPAPGKPWTCGTCLYRTRPLRALFPVSLPDGPKVKPGIAGPAPKAGPS